MMGEPKNMDQLLNAIQALIAGEWDHPDLVAMGDLHTDPLDDIALWVHNMKESRVRKLDTTTARFSEGIKNV